jgi:hypothetical protein
MSEWPPFNYDEVVRKLFKDFIPGRRVNALVRQIYTDRESARISGTIISAELITQEYGNLNIRVKLKDDDGETYERMAYSGFYSNVLVFNERGDGYL